MRPAIAAALAALTLAGCAGQIGLEPPPETRADPDGIMADVLPRWTAAIGVQPDEVPPYRIYFASAPIECGEADPKLVVGCTYPPVDGVRDVVVRDDLTAEAGFAVATHEVGHLMGAGHTVDGVMSEAINLQAPELTHFIDQDAIDLVCAAGRVPCRFQSPEPEPEGNIE